MNAAKVLEQPVLVLNKRWEAIHLASVKEAIGLVAKGSAMIIEPGTLQTHHLLSWNDVSKAQKEFGGARIRSCHLALVPPKVILLTKYEKLGERSVVFSRRNLFKRDRYTCQYCGAQPADHGELTMDHVVPRSKGGQSTWENAVLACVGCNKRKSDRTPEAAGMKLRKIPKKPSWRMLAQVPKGQRDETWEQFLSRAYWEVELES